MRIIHHLTKRDCNLTMDNEHVHFVQEIAKTRSTHAPLTLHFWDYRGQ